jgi:predicted restriction endonuclease
MGNTNRDKKNLVPNVCEIPGCKYNIVVTKHRIKPGRKGGKYVAGNVIGLCPNHHVEAELGLFSQYELFEIVHRRLKQNRKKRAGKV